MCIRDRFGKGYKEIPPVYYEPEPVVVEKQKPAPVVEQPQPRKEVVDVYKRQT